MIVVRSQRYRFKGEYFDSLHIRSTNYLAAIRTVEFYALVHWPPPLSSGHPLNRAARL